MRTAGGGLGIGRWWVVGALAMGVSSALAVAFVLAAPGGSIPRGPVNLSSSADRRSYFDADIAVSPDGGQVAVAWSEEYTSGVSPQRGSVKLSWAMAGTAGVWSAPMTVFTGTDQACVSGVAAAITGTMAHLAYVVRQPCSAVGITHTIYYQTCTLGGSLGDRQVITSATLSGDEMGFWRPDIALDAQSNPHFIYLYYGDAMAAEEGVGTVYYRPFAGGVPGSQERVSGVDVARSPAIAWSNGCVHAVWEDLSEGEEDSQIIYRRRDVGWEVNSVNLTNNRGNKDYRPRNPDIVARGGDVVVVWDWEWPEGGQMDQFALTYAYSSTGMTEWRRAREVGTEADLSNATEGIQPERTYTSTSSADWDVAPYLLHLRPSVALDKDGKPIMVWHTNRASEGDFDYDIMYIRAQTMTVTDTVWLSPTLLASGSSKSGDPVVAVAPISPTRLHVAYVYNRNPVLGEGDWETYYVGVVIGDGGQDDLMYVFLPLVMRNFSQETLSRHSFTKPVRVDPVTD
jgi:hypothetical protein